MNIPGRAIDLGLAAVMATQLGASAWLVPVGDHVALPNGESLGGLCWFRAALHIECPFCGMTRSFVALAHGDALAAIRFHPAGPLLFVAMAVALMAIVMAFLRRGQPLVERRSFVTAFEAIVVVCMAIGAFKMVRS